MYFGLVSYNLAKINSDRLKVTKCYDFVISQLVVENQNMISHHIYPRCCHF